MTHDKAALKIYETASITSRRDFRIEDMLFTGIFREKSRIKDIRGLKTAVCEHYQTMKPQSTEFEILTKLYLKGKLQIRQQT